MDNLLSWLMDTEAQMNGGMARMERMEKSEKDGNQDQLTQQLHQCQAGLDLEIVSNQRSFVYLLHSRPTLLSSRSCSPV